MSARTALLVVAACALVAFAGCSHRAGADAGSGEALGTLRGVVVDPGIRPLARVQVTTQGPHGTLWSNTSASGGFEFPPLPYGAYVVTAHRLGFLDVRTTVQVDGTPRVARIQMEPGATAAPYATAHLFRGFLECSTTAIGATFAACAVPNLVPLAVAIATCDLGAPTPCTQLGNLTADHNSLDIPVDGRPLWVQHETVWEATQSLGDQLHVFVSGGQGGGLNATSAELNDTAGPSPLLTVLNTTVLQGASIGPGSTLTLAIFAGGMEQSGSQVCVPRVEPATRGSCFWDTGATLEQEYRVYTHLFYGFTPPPGYRFSSDGDPVPPQA
jgi:hypothetical protein